MDRFLTTFFLTLLRAYKWALSPLLPPACRYVPTCSDYAAEAIERHGAFRGSAMAIWRVLRCHPFVRGGYDPVPVEVVNDFENEDSLRRTAPSTALRAGLGGCPHTSH